MTLKRVLIGLVVLVVAVIVAGYAILSQMDMDRLRGIIEAEAKTATGRDLKIAGPIDLNISLTPSISVQDVSFANTKWGSEPNMVTLKEFDVEVAILPLLSGEIEVKRLVFIEPKILLEVNRKGRGNWVLAKPKGQAAETAPEPSEPAADSEPGELVFPTIGEFTIQGGSVIFKNRQTKERYNLALDQVNATTDGATTAMTLSLTGSYNGSPIEMQADIGSIANLASGQSSSLKTNIKAGGADLKVDGTLANKAAGPEFDLLINVAGKSLADLSDLAGTPVPPLGPYSLKADLVGKGQTYKVSDMALTMGQSDLSGDAEVSLAGERPAVTAALASKLFDMKDFSAEAEQKKKKKKAKKEEPAQKPGEESKFVFTKDPLPLDGLSAADANVKVNVAEARLADKMKVNDIEVVVDLQNGHLKVSPLSAVFAEGKIDGGVDVNSAVKKPEVAVDIVASGINYGKLLKEMDIEKNVAGKINVDVALAGRGKSMRQIASTLSGNTSIVTQNGTINNRVIKILAVGLDNVMGPLLAGENNVQLHCFVSKFKINKGQANSKAFLLDSEVLTVIGSGKVNLKKETLDLHFDTATTEASLSSLAIPFDVTGTLKQPKVKADALGAASSAAKAVSGLADDDSLLGQIAKTADETLSGGEQQAASGEGLCQQALTGKKPKTNKKSKKKTESGDKASGTDALKEVEDNLKKSLGFD